MNSAKGVAPFAYLDIVLDGVVNLAEDKFSRQKLIIFPALLHQIALHSRTFRMLLGKWTGRKQ